MELKFLAIAHNTNNYEIDDNEVINLLSRSELFDTRIITEIEEDNRVPFKNTFMRLSVNKYLGAHIKDLNILSILLDFDIKEYDGILFLDLNKFSNNVELVENLILDCYERESILTPVFINDVPDGKDYSIRSKYKHIKNGFTFIPSSRIKEFCNIRIDALKDYRYYLFNSLQSEPNNKLSFSLSNKWKYLDFGNDNEVSAFNYIFTEYGVPYGVVEGSSLRNSNDSYSNVTLLRLFRYHVVENGSRIDYCSNSIISSGSMGIIKPKLDPGNCVRIKGFSIKNTRNKPICRTNTNDDYTRCINELLELLKEEIND